MVHTQVVTYIGKSQVILLMEKLYLVRYRSPDLTFNDPGIRKHMQRVILNYKPEAAIDADLLLDMTMKTPIS